MKVIFVWGKHSKVVRIRKGEYSAVKSCLFNEVTKHPQYKIFWISFRFSEIGSFMPIKDMMNSYEYIDVVERKVIPGMWRPFPDGERKFQQDYFPCLSSKKVKTVFRKQKLNVLDWPGAGVFKLRPAGQMRPAKPFHPAREAILSMMKK